MPNRISLRNFFNDENHCITKIPSFITICSISVRHFAIFRFVILVVCQVFCFHLFILYIRMMKINQIVGFRSTAKLCRTQLNEMIKETSNYFVQKMEKKKKLAKLNVTNIFSFFV